MENSSSTSRTALIEKTAEQILNLKLSHPVRVGIDGITASGKSTFARDLALVLQAKGCAVISTSLDGFHHPRVKRYGRGRNSAEGYYYDAYNYSAVIENLLAPLGPSGNFNYKTQVFDVRNDVAVEIDFSRASPDSILIVDGSFALRNELRDYWDFKIYIKVDFATAEERASVRDADLFQSADLARSVTRNRYHEAHRIHIEISRPADLANLVICNKDPLNPKIEANNI